MLGPSIQTTYVTFSHLHNLRATPLRGVEVKTLRPRWCHQRASPTGELSKEDTFWGCPCASFPSHPSACLKCPWARATVARVRAVPGSQAGTGWGDCCCCVLALRPAETRSSQPPSGRLIVLGFFHHGGDSNLSSCICVPCFQHYASTSMYERKERLTHHHGTPTTWSRIKKRAPRQKKFSKERALMRLTGLTTALGLQKAMTWQPSKAACWRLHYDDSWESAPSKDRGTVQKAVRALIQQPMHGAESLTLRMSECDY